MNSYIEQVLGSTKRPFLVLNWFFTIFIILSYCTDSSFSQVTCIQKCTFWPCLVYIFSLFQYFNGYMFFIPKSSNLVHIHLFLFYFCLFCFIISCSVLMSSVVSLNSFNMLILKFLFHKVSFIWREFNPELLVWVGIIFSIQTSSCVLKF